MKNLIKKFSWWLVMPFFMILFLVSCLNQKKNIESSKNKLSEKKQEESSIKTETKTEQESSDKSLVKIVDSTIIFNSKTELLEYVKKNFSKQIESENSGKNSAKITEQEEYFENGKLKSKSKTSENTSEYLNSLKSAYQEIQEKYNKAAQSSEYWEENSTRFETEYRSQRATNYYLNDTNKKLASDIKILQEEKKKLTENTPVTIWQKILFAWRYIVFAFFFGWFVMPFVWRWFKSWLLRFTPYLNFLDWLNRQKSST